MLSRSAPFVGLSCGLLIGLACGHQPTDPPTEDRSLEPGREPFVAGFEPRSSTQGSRVALRVTGENFDPGSRVDLLFSGDTVSEVQTLSTEFVTGKELVADISIGDRAPLGAYQVQVTTSKGKRGIPIEDFVVVEGSEGEEPDGEDEPEEPAVPTTGVIRGRVVGDDFWLSGFTVQVTGPASRTTISDSLGHFLFEELPPGTYTVTAAPDRPGWTCSPSSATVSAGATTFVVVGCTRVPPIVTEISGRWWFFYDQYRGPFGAPFRGCPTGLDDAWGFDNVEGFVTFHSSSDTVVISGLDPQLAIRGNYEEESGMYEGIGTSVFGDGSSVVSEIWGRFLIDHDVEFYADWLRRHLDASGSEVCREIYVVEAGRLEEVQPSNRGSVTLSPDSLTVPVYDTAQLTVIVRDEAGTVIADPQVAFLVEGLMPGTVDSNGLVTGLPGGCGSGTVTAQSRGVNSNTVHLDIGSPSGEGCWDY